jgi:hypothetical protein
MFKFCAKRFLVPFIQSSLYKKMIFLLIDANVLGLLTGPAKPARNRTTEQHGDTTT